MKTVIRFRWLILFSWVIAAVLLVWKAPGMEGLVREKGQVTVPDQYPSAIAEELKKKHSDKGDAEPFIIVFHDQHTLKEQQIEDIKETVLQLKKNKQSLGIANITTHFDEAELEEQLVSIDGKTILAILDIQIGNREIADIRNELSKIIATKNVETLMTGNELITEDVIISSEKGLKKTEFITVGFILIVLILVFRSFIAPIIPLLTIGITYLVSQSIVAFLVDILNFPLSNFTQIFLVAVLFGIGTDYCILLLSRFKEELGAEKDIIPAIVSTYQTAGKTVLYSGLAVMVGFASIGFAQFKLYQSAAAVAIGIVILMLALMTIVPFFMATLQRKLFWPVGKNISHKQSRVWEWAGNLAIVRPFVALGIVAILTIPLLLSYKGDLSFSSLDEIDENYDSVKAFHIVSNSFSPGETLPIQVVLENDDSLKTKEYLALIEKISSNLTDIEHVEKVRSATRPVGNVIKELYIKEQVGAISDGMEQGNEGIHTIKNGLDDAAKALLDSKPQLEEATSGIDALQAGTKDIRAGMSELQRALRQIEQGMQNGSHGAGELKVGVREAKNKADELAAGAKKLLTSFRDMQEAISQLSIAYEQMPNGLSTAQQRLIELGAPLEKLIAAYPELVQDENFQTIQAGIGKTTEQITIANSTIEALNGQMQKIANGLSSANDQFGFMTAGLDAFSSGLNEISAGLSQLETGIGKAADGQHEIIKQLPELDSSLGQIANGQSQMLSGFGSIDGQLEELTDGLEQSAGGLGEIEAGLGEAKGHLNRIADESNLEASGLFIPEEVFENEDFEKALDVYFSEDGKLTTLDVVLSMNPYKNEAMELIEPINKTIESSVKGTKLENAKIGIGGVTSINHDLETMSNADYNRTLMIILFGISLILVILLRSLIMPIYLIASLLLTFYSSIAVTELVFVHLLGYPGLSWATPFFGFVILMALGVDYSIFLMDRFTEYRNLDVKTGLLLAMKNMGTVIISAAIILAGTFAAMLPSGVLSLLQIATLVLSGLLFYAFIVLPLFVPVLVKTFEKVNWWPFRHHEKR